MNCSSASPLLNHDSLFFTLPHPSTFCYPLHPSLSTCSLILASSLVTLPLIYHSTPCYTFLPPSFFTLLHSVPTFLHPASFYSTFLHPASHMLHTIPTFSSPCFTPLHPIATFLHPVSSY